MAEHMTEKRRAYFERMQTKLFNVEAKAHDAQYDLERLRNRWRQAIREELDSNPDAINSDWIAYHVINDPGLEDVHARHWQHFHPDPSPTGHDWQAWANGILGAETAETIGG